MTTEEQNAQQLQELLNGYQVTDDEGALNTETENSGEELAPQEETTEEETASPEKDEELPKSTPKADEEDSETELAEDESGKRYIPESRFKKEYGKRKSLERELEALRQAQVIQPNSAPQQYVPSQPVSVTEELEVEMLFDKFPQFDPESEDYSRTLDQLGAKIKQANPTMSRLAAAKEALRIARDISTSSAQVQAEARKVKALTSDQGITSRVTTRQDTQVDTSKMSLDELEAHLKSTGEWNKF